MPSPHRTEKLESLIKEELSKIIGREIDVPAGSLITITRISFSPDGYYAKVYTSIIAKDPKDVLTLLKKNIYEIQQTLNRRLSIRPVPKIRFTLDDQEINREKIEKSLSELKRKGEL